MAALDSPSATASATLPLPLGEPVQALNGVLGDLVVTAVTQLLDQALGHRRREDRLATGEHVDGPGELAGRGVLEQVATGAGLQGVEHVGVQVEGGQDQHRRRVRERCDLAGRGDTVQDRHLQVHEYDVRVMRPRTGHRLCAVGSLGHKV